MSDLQNPIFHDDDKAREWLESHLWPEGPVCPHCGAFGATGLHGKAHRPGLYQCNACREQFTVTVGTLFERSKIGLSKWLMATYLLCASKKGMSTRQISRMLGVSVKSTWFMTHRIREAMREGKFPGPIVSISGETGHPKIDRITVVRYDPPRIHLEIAVPEIRSAGADQNRLARLAIQDALRALQEALDSPSALPGFRS